MQEIRELFVSALVLTTANPSKSKRNLTLTGEPASDAHTTHSLHLFFDWQAGCRYSVAGQERFLL